MDITKIYKFIKTQDNLSYDKFMNYLDQYPDNYLSSLDEQKKKIIYNIINDRSCKLLHHDIHTFKIYILTDIFINHNQDILDIFINKLDLDINKIEDSNYLCNYLYYQQLQSKYLDQNKIYKINKLIIKSINYHTDIYQKDSNDMNILDYAKILDLKYQTHFLELINYNYLDNIKDPGFI